MRIIDESLIPTGDAAYFKQGTWTHLQKAYKEAIDALAQCVIKDYDPTKVYILYGCVATGTNPGARTFTAGAVYYGGEVYLVPAASFTTTGANVAVANITEVFNTTDYAVDPQTTPGGAAISLHTIRTIVISAGAANSGDAPDFTAWLDHGNAHKNAYTDISSTVSVDAAFTTVIKIVREYEDGTITVSFLGTYAGARTYAATILSGLPKLDRSKCDMCLTSGSAAKQENIITFGSVTTAETQVGVGGLDASNTYIDFHIEYKKK